MYDITFKPITSAAADIVALAAALAEDYTVTDDATHYALTSVDEVGIVYPTRDGHLILVYPLADAAKLIELNERQKAARNEDEEQVIIAERDASVASPDEHGLSADDMKRADNGDGTFTLRARTGLI